ncbi:MAG: adenylate/guanylate cyclase domain-containing protein [Pseudomonadota bacterium]
MSNIMSNHHGQYLFKLLGLCFLLILNTASIAETKTLILNEDIDSQNLFEFLEVLEEGPDDTWTIEEVLQRQDLFESAQTKTLDEQDTILPVAYARMSKKYWFRFKVQNLYNRPLSWYLLFDAHPITLKFFRVDPQGNILALGEAGLDQPTSKRSIKYSRPLTKVSTLPNSEHWIYILSHHDLTLTDPRPLVGRFAVLSSSGLLARTHYAWLVGLLLGGIAVIGLYNLLLFFFIRENVYLYYVAYIAAFCSVATLGGGAWRLYFFQENAISHNYLLVGTFLVACLIISIFRFAQAFLKTHDYSPRLHRLLYVLMGSCLFGSVLTVVVFLRLSSDSMLFDSLSVNLTVVSLLLALLWGIGLLSLPLIGAWVWWRGFKPARFYVLAWSLPILAIALLGINVWAGFLSAKLMGELPMVAFLLETLLLSFALGDRFKILGEEKAATQQLLGKVVSPAIADELMAKEVKLGGEQREATILFSDIRGFTTLSENRSPEEVLQLLNEYLSEVSAVIDRNHGVVDKYVGDEVMALFGAPLQRPDDAANAVRTALEMRETLIRLNQGFRERDMPEIGVGVGINTGLVVAGNMGSEQRLNYTVIGDSVNLASRLEGLTKQYGVELVVSESTNAVAPDFIYRELDKVRVKGKLEPVKIYEVMGAQKAVPEAILQEVEAHHAALKLFQAQSWQDAQVAFTELREQYPQTRLYQLYQERIAAYLEAPPDADWDGVYTLQEK